ncbi:MAG: nucleoside-diphosphate kinase [Candidatus Babeliaceae bacterium]|nr:nucleoside-diphosphate kinase [Candidatus Babeliaceae bacterium]
MKQNTFIYFLLLAMPSLIIAYSLYRRSKSYVFSHEESHVSYDDKSTFAIVTTQPTFALIKPDFVAAGKAQDIIKIIQDHGFVITAQREMIIDRYDAEELYAMHKDKPFFNDLVSYITSSPVIALVLEKENAVQEWQDLMGEADPHKAKKGTIRNLFGTDTQHNAVHGSDSIESSKNELALFFSEKYLPNTQSREFNELDSVAGTKIITR